MKKLRRLTDEEIRKLDGESVIIKLDIDDPKFIDGFSFVLKNEDRIYIEPDMDDSSYVVYLRKIEEEAR